MPYGRGRAIELVHRFSVRDGSAPQPAPVIIFVGHRGSGKSTLLELLVEVLDQNVPYAHLRFPADDKWPIPKVLSLLVQDLNAHCAAYGRRIAFPRFIVGSLVLQAEIDHTDPDSARAQIRDLLARHRNLHTLEDSIAQMLKALTPGIGDAALRTAIDLLVKSVASRWIRTGALLGKGAKWYSHQDHGPARDYLDELRKLNRLAQSADQGGRQVDAVMLRAFLADLRDDFERRGRDRGSNCLILLDNADTPSGRAFLELLRNAFHDSDEDSPITVVATSRGPLVAPYATSDEPFPTTDEASVADYLGKGRWCYPVRLTDLTVDQVKAMVRKADAGDPEKIAPAVHRFTRGHAGATAEVVRAIKEMRDRLGDHAVDLRKVVDHVPFGVDGGRAVRERLLDMFLDGLPAKTRDHLITCAAARDHREAGELVGPGRPIGRDGAAVLSETTIWLPGVTAGPARMHPVLRRLLLDRLARRHPQAPNGWTAVHELLRSRAANKAGELHHALALGKVEEVVDELTRRLRDPGMGVKAWLTLLEKVATAPHREPFKKAPVDHAQELARGVTPTDELTVQVARLLTALWVANEPLARGDRTALLTLVNDAFEKVAIECPKTGAMMEAKTEFLRRVQGEEGHLRDIGGPRNPWSPPRRRRRWLVALIVALVLIVVAPLIICWIRGCGIFAPTCASGVPKVEVEVAKGETREECVGVTDSFAFEPRFRHVVDTLAKENAYATEGGPGSYVTIAFLGPLTNPDPRVVHQLEGAVTAQHRSNREALVGDRPRIRMVLANTSSTAAHWRKVTDDLVDMTKEQDRLVAVASMGLSQDETRWAAERLSGVKLPMVVDIVTSEEIDKNAVNGIARVSPTTDEELAALGRYVPEKSRLRRAMMVSYSQENDLYTRSLVRGFERHFADLWRRGGRINNPFGEDPANEFRTIIGNLCSENAPDTVLYAGRGKDLPLFLAYLGNRNCHPERITVLTGSDAVRLMSDTAENAPGIAALRSSHNPISLLYVPLAEPSVLRDPSKNPAAAQYLKFEQSFQGLGFATADLSTGWAIMAHDAVLTAAHAVRRAALSGELPEPAAVRNQIYLITSAANSVPGASGEIRIDSATGNRISQLLPVLRFRPGEEPELLGLYDSAKLRR